MVKLRPLYQGAIITLFTVVVLNGAHLDINQNYGATNNETIQVENQYEELENNVQSNDPDNKGLIEKLKTLRNPLEDPFATIGAGLFIIPQIIGLLTAPLDIAGAFLSSVGSTFAGFLSPRITNFVYLMMAVAVAFGLLEAYLRMNEA